MFRLISVVVCALVVATTATGAVAPVRVSTLVATGFAHPSDVTSAPAEKARVYVVEQRGLVRIVVNRRVLPHPFLDLRSQVKTSLLRGLFSLTFHPHYGRDARFYVDFVAKDGNLKVVEYRARAGRALADSARTLFDVAVGTDHYGGAMAFGPDGRLYVGVGDGNVAGDAQNPDSPRGKILRFDVDDPAATAELVALGFRNPWRFAFDARGGLFIGDVGANIWEELDYVPPRHTEVPNFGWNLYEGRRRTTTPLPVPPPRLVAPLLTYKNPAKRCAAVVAGPVIRGRYYYGDLCDYWVASFRLRNGRPFDWRRERFIVPEGIVSFGRGPGGRSYAVSLTGKLYRLPF
jgi:glucose/arabinose dehydrogenase